MRVSFFSALTIQEIKKGIKIAETTYSYMSCWTVARGCDLSTVFAISRRVGICLAVFKEFFVCD